jgi:hypothetical protein
MPSREALQTDARRRLGGCHQRSAGADALCVECSRPSSRSTKPARHAGGACGTGSQQLSVSLPRAASPAGGGGRRPFVMRSCAGDDEPAISVSADRRRRAAGAAGRRALLRRCVRGGERDAGAGATTNALPAFGDRLRDGLGQCPTTSRAGQPAMFYPSSDGSQFTSCDGTDRQPLRCVGRSAAAFDLCTSCDTQSCARADADAGSAPHVRRGASSPSRPAPAHRDVQLVLSAVARGRRGG